MDLRAFRQPKWHTFCAVFRSLNRRAELERLTRWATRKKYPGPRRLYQRRLGDEELALFRYVCRYPRLMAWARRLHWLAGLITTTPRYPAKGSAAVYRYGYERLDKPGKKPIVEAQ